MSSMYLYYVNDLKVMNQKKKEFCFIYRFIPQPVKYMLDDINFFIVFGEKITTNGYFFYSEVQTICMSNLSIAFSSFNILFLLTKRENRGWLVSLLKEFEQWGEN